MPDDEVVSLLKRLHAGWPKPSWSWDGRFSMASSAVSGADIDVARATASATMPNVYDVVSLETAPPALRSIVDGCGGLRGNQLAFCDDPTSPRVVGLWWPWGSGGTVSLRVGRIDGDEASLRAVFSIA